RVSDTHRCLTPGDTGWKLRHMIQVSDTYRCQTPGASGGPPAWLRYKAVGPPFFFQVLPCDMNVREYYEQALAERGYQPDAAQKQAIDRLQAYYDDWVRFKAMRSNALKKLLNRPDVPRGVYLWGGVGRGKSFLMDAFYATVPVVRKTRLHFHEFMRG